MTWQSVQESFVSPTLWQSGSLVSGLEECRGESWDFKPIGKQNIIGTLHQASCKVSLSARVTKGIQYLKRRFLR